VVPGPSIKIGALHFTFGPPVATYIQGKGKIKNAKIQQWRLELSVFNYKV